MKKQIQQELTKRKALLVEHPDSKLLEGNVAALEWVLSLKPIRKRFVKPTIEEVIDYFEEKECVEPISNAHAFYDHYESINWYVGKKKMYLWKASVSGWIRRNKEGRPNMPTNYSQDTTNLNNDDDVKRMNKLTGH